MRGKSRPVAEILKIIAKLDQPATNTGSTRVFYLSYGDAPTIAEVLNGILSGQSDEEGAEDTQIQADESLNAIVVRADRNRITEIEDIIERLDVRRAQVLIEAAIVEVSMTDTRDLGVDFAAIDQSSGTDSSVPLVTSPAHRGDPEPHRRVPRPRTASISCRAWSVSKVPPSASPR